MLERNSLAGALNTQFSQPISLKLLSTGKKTFAIDENLEDRFTTHFLNSSLLTSNSRPKEMIFLESRRSLNLRLKMHYMKYVLILFKKKIITIAVYIICNFKLLRLFDTQMQ